MLYLWTGPSHLRPGALTREEWLQPTPWPEVVRGAVEAVGAGHPG